MGRRGLPDVIEVGATAKDLRGRLGRVVLGLTYTVFEGLTQVVEVVLRKEVAGSELMVSWHRKE